VASQASQAGVCHRGQILDIMPTRPETGESFMNPIRTLCLCAITATFIFTSSIAHAAGTGTNIGVRLVGTDTAYLSDDIFDAYGVEGPTAYCWDFILEDINTGNVIGEVTDCGAIVGVIGGTLGVDDIEDLGFQVIGTTFFHLPGGTVGTQVLTTVQPVTHGSLDYTHITGAIPQPDDNNVIYGDGRFASAEGSARLSGTGNFSQFLSTGEISADCVFVLDLN